jgi:hypothetical protein
MNPVINGAENANESFISPSPSRDPRDPRAIRDLQNSNRQPVISVSMESFAQATLPPGQSS